MRIAATRQGRVSAILGILVLVGPACSEGGGIGGGGPAWLADEARPVALTLALEGDNGSTKRIGPAGGTISATAADGTVYRLRIPADALIAPEDITMVPVASVEGLPEGGRAVAAVQLEPDGLQLFQPATLTIRPAAEVPADERVGLGWFGLGQDAHSLATEGDDRVELSLLHFSGYGIGAYPASHPGRLALQRAASHQARLSSRVGALIEKERARGEESGGFSEAGLAELAVIFSEYFDFVLEDILRTAESDDAMAVCAIELYFSWLRQVQLLGLVSEDMSAVDPELEKRRVSGEKSFEAILENFYAKRRERLLRRCYEEHDLDIAAGLIAVERMQQMLGTDQPVESSVWWKDLFASCLQFELTFESRFNVDWPGGRSRHAVRADLPFSLDATPHGSAPLVYTDFVMSGKPWNVLLGGGAIQRALVDGTVSGVNTSSGTLTVFGLTWERNPIKKPGVDCKGGDTEVDAGEVGDMTLTFSPGVPSETVHYVNTSVIAQQFGSAAEREFNATHYDWLDSWTRYHAAEEVEVPGIAPAGLQDVDDQGNETWSGGAYQIRLLPVGPGEWRAIYESSVGGQSHEITAITVKHTPRQSPPS